MCHSLFVFNLINGLLSITFFPSHLFSTPFNFVVRVTNHSRPPFLPSSLALHTMQRVLAEAQGYLQQGRKKGPDDSDDEDDEAKEEEKKTQDGPEEEEDEVIKQARRKRAEKIVAALSGEDEGSKEEEDDD